MDIKYKRSNSLNKRKTSANPSPNNVLSKVINNNNLNNPGFDRRRGSHRSDYLRFLKTISSTDRRSLIAEAYK
jgi:hypothetical protein